MSVIFSCRPKKCSSKRKNSNIFSFQTKKTLGQTAQTDPVCYFLFKNSVSDSPGRLRCGSCGIPIQDLQIPNSWKKTEIILSVFEDCDRLKISRTRPVQWELVFVKYSVCFSPNPVCSVDQLEKTPPCRIHIRYHGSLLLWRTGKLSTSVFYLFSENKKIFGPINFSRP